MLSMLVAPKSHWSYFEFHPTVGPSLDLINEEEGLYEVVIRRHPDPKYAWTTSVFDVFPELEEWRTRDVVRRCPDPGFENLWKYEGRLDDILLLSNGLKVNPLHVETVIQTHPLLSGCLVFGDGHTACGILLEVRDPEISVEEIVEEVWPAIEEANGKVPEHARVERGLVVVSSKEKKFVRSSKQAPIRKVNYKLYREEIEEAYRRE
jgi:long-subunit acyl-CoA synthetase (AMP-forming)